MANNLIDALIDKFRSLGGDYQKLGEIWRANSYRKVANQLQAYAELNKDIKILDEIIPTIPKFKTRVKFEEYRGGSKPKEWTKDFKKLAKITKAEFKKRKIAGIGDGIVAKIIEWISIGDIKKIGEIELEVKKFKKKRPEKDKIIESFTWNAGGIWGVGPIKAKELYKKGFRSIDKVDPDALTDPQKIGLKYYKELRIRLERNYITIFQNVLKYILDEDFGKGTYRLQIAGSYRREKLTTGDIDCLVTSDKFTLGDMIDSLKKWKVVTDVLSMRGEKFMGIAHCPSDSKGHFRLDIEFVPEYEWYPALLYFTGSKQFNTEMRQTAKDQGYHLDQHGLYKKLTDKKSKEIAKKIDINLESYSNANQKKKARENGYALSSSGLFEIISPINSEKKLFDILGMQYLQPKSRR